MGRLQVIGHGFYSIIDLNICDIVNNFSHGRHLCDLVYKAYYMYVTYCELCHDVIKSHMIYGYRYTHLDVYVTRIYTVEVQRVKEDAGRSKE